MNAGTHIVTKMVHPGKWRWMVMDLYDATVAHGCDGKNARDASKKARTAQLVYVSKQAKKNGAGKKRPSSCHMKH